MNRVLLLAAFTLLGACGSDPPPPTPNQKVACDTLDFCKLSSSGFSCDGDKQSSCAQCINGSTCDAIRAGTCAPNCPGVSFKPK